MTGQFNTEAIARQSLPTRQVLTNLLVLSLVLLWATACTPRQQVRKAPALAKRLHSPHQRPPQVAQKAQTPKENADAKEPQPAAKQTVSPVATLPIHTAFDESIQPTTPEMPMVHRRPRRLRIRHKVRISSNCENVRQIKRLLYLARTAFARCAQRAYKRYTAANPNHKAHSPTYRMYAHWRINPKGRAYNARIDSEPSAPKLSACIQAVIMAIRFPRSSQEEPVMMNYPLVFSFAD